MSAQRFRAQVLEDFNEHFQSDDVVFASQKTKLAAERKMGVKVQRPDDAHVNSFPDLMETFVGVERVVPTRKELPDDLTLAPAFIYTCKGVECNKAEDGRTLIFNARRIEGQWFTTSCLVCTELKSKRCDVVNTRLEQRPGAETNGHGKRPASEDDGHDDQVAKRQSTRTSAVGTSSGSEAAKAAPAASKPGLFDSPFKPGLRGENGGPQGGSALEARRLTDVTAELRFQTREVDTLRKDRQAREERIKSLKAELEEQKAENMDLRKSQQEATDELKAQVADLRKAKDAAEKELELSVSRRPDGASKSSERHTDALSKALDAQEKTINILESQLKAANDKIADLEQAAVGTSLRKVTKAVADLTARFDLVRNDHADQLSLLLNAQRDIKDRLGLGGDDKITALEDSIDEIRDKLGMEDKL
ncbi:uncharacterized protein LOC62_03G005186 [Vanrija pseudolonga]|uniref:Uncharacterized protein n=1 Tax=Vanrija pseudolonga TaxID=143232 RepID=A0AAF0Y7J7_9TREE|nr:hypothetical protein LOC62_03G005186 [Vanrija pseudolonga]